MKKISIITPTYNRSKCIYRCICSVAYLWKVNGIRVEHIVVDDGSTDKTKDILDECKGIKTIYLKENTGVMNARQVGINSATGDYILFLDSDDELVRDTLNIISESLLMYPKYKVYKFMTENAKTGQAMCKMNIIYKNIFFKDTLSGEQGSGEFITLFHKSVFKKIPYNKGTLAFEMLFNHETSRHFNSEINIPVVILKFHKLFGSLSSYLLHPKNAKKRTEDYFFYIQTFKKDYSKFFLLNELRTLYKKLGLYQACAGNMNNARIAFKRSGQKVFRLLTYTHKSVFILMLLLYRVIIRR